MILYILIFGGVFAWYYTTPQRKANNTKVLFAVLLFLALFVGLGDMLGGYDRYIYGAHFDYLADFVYFGDYRGAFTNFWTEGKRTEWGFSFLYVMISFITRNRYIYILIITLIIYSLLFISFKRYFRNYPMGIMLFFGLWFFFSFTYLRQVLACSIAWFSIRYIIKRDFIRFIVCIIVAYLMHNSAIVFFPLYFVPIRKFEKEKVINVMILLGVIGVTNVAGMIFTTFGGIIGAEERTEAYAESTAFRYEYIIEAVLFLIVILRYYRHFKNKDKEEILLLNMSLFFCGILLLFSMNTQGGRLSWFYMIGLIATLTKVGISEKRLSQNNMMIILLVFALFFRIVWEWGDLLSPYKTFLTDGVRDGDRVWVEYEYDHRYDKDKLYRDPWTLW